MQPPWVYRRRENRREGYRVRGASFEGITVYVRTLEEFVLNVIHIQVLGMWTALS